MHRAEFSHIGISHMDVQALTLVDERTSSGSQVKHLFLRNFPNGLVKLTDFFGNFGNLLHRTIEVDQFVLNSGVPQIQSD